MLLSWYSGYALPVALLQTHTNLSEFNARRNMRGFWSLLAFVAVQVVSTIGLWNEAPRPLRRVWRNGVHALRWYVGQVAMSCHLGAAELMKQLDVRQTSAHTMCRLREPAAVATKIRGLPTIGPCFGAHGASSKSGTPPAPVCSGNAPLCCFAPAQCHPSRWNRSFAGGGEAAAAAAPWAN